MDCSDNFYTNCLIHDVCFFQRKLFKKIKAIENPISGFFDIELYQRSSEGSLIDFIDLGFEDTRYIAEKRKGGKSAHKDHQAVKAQVDTFCIEELNKKIHPSAMQLSKYVVKRMIDEFPKLLQSFQPYKTHLVDGSDWTNPTFYRWCKKTYKLFKNKLEVVNEERNLCFYSCNITKYDIL